MKPGWILAASAIAWLVLSIWFFNRQHSNLLAAQRDAEGARLALAHQVVAAEETRQELQGSITDLLNANEGLRAAYQTAMAAAPDAAPVAAASLDTGLLKVQRAQASTAAHAPLTTHGNLPPSSRRPDVLALTPENTMSPVCVLTDADNASISVEEITLQTKAGNQIVAGVATAYRETPTKQRLAGGRFVSVLSRTEALAPPVPPRWGVLALGLCEARGCGLGAGVLFPPLSVLGARLEAQAGLLSGPSPAVTAGLGVRW